MKPSIGIDWYKTGAIFTKPTVAGLAEAGPEAIVPIDTLWNKLDRIADATNGGNTYNFNITVSGTESPEKYARRLVRQMKMELRMAARHTHRSMGASLFILVHREGMGMLMRTNLVQLRHMRTGNETGEISAVEKEVQEFLIRN